jgi:acyl-CoA synthetase (AMP-forming)/AMP-acid ligase II
MQWLFDRFASQPGRTAFVHEGRRVSYGQVIQISEAFSAKLAELGVRAGDRVAVLADYSPEVFCFILAITRSRGIVVPISRAAAIEEGAALGISGCEWMARFDDKGREPQIKAHQIDRQSPLVDDLRSAGSPGLILFSSGSTGSPKGILHDFAKVAEKFRKMRDPVIAIPFLMIDHFGGVNTLLAITANLGTVVTVADRSAANICEAIETFRVELLPATPSFLTLMMASGLHRHRDLTSLKRITYGTEVMPQTTLDRVRAAFPGVDLLQTYGLSEVGVLRSRSRSDGSLWVQVGGEGFETKIVDEILFIRSAFAMAGYLNAPSAFDSEGWFNTQDKVVEEDGWLKILGRVTDLINVGGQKVYPAEIENLILTMDNIVDVTVFGEAHALLGQIVVAKVVLETPEPPDGLKKRIRAACLADLAGFKAPSRVLISEVPLYTNRQKKVRRI